MGALGESIRNVVRGIISNSSIKFPITITPVARTKGDFGGYESTTETKSSSRIVDSVPSDYLKDRVSFQKFGDLKEGEVRMLIRDDETIDTTDQVTFESKNYNIRTINPIAFNEVIIVQELILSEKME